MKPIAPPDIVSGVERKRKDRGSIKPVLLLAVLLGLAAVLWFFPVKQYLISVLQWVQGLGPWGPVLVVPMYVVATLLFLPGSVLTLGAGFLFGLSTGVVAVWIGANLGACAAFIVGRTVAREWVRKKVANNQKFAAVDRAIGKEGFKVVLLLRLSPVFPFNLLNYALGLTRVSFGHYVLASMVGMIPATFMYVYLGSAARSLADAAAGQVEGGLGGKIFFWMGLAATAAVVALVTRIAQKSFKEAEAVAVGEIDRPPERQAPPLTESLEVVPMDEHNRELAANTHPSDWINPEPAGRYNLVVIGAGTAGLVTAAGAAGLGAKVALVERHLLGGDCLNYGCVPSKCIMRSSRVLREIADASRYGITVDGNVRADFPAVMERMRGLRARISHHDSVSRFSGLGVDVFLGHARFVGPDAVTVGGKTLRFSRAVIATGARAAHPGTKGLAEAGFLTNETVFSLTRQPRKLAVFGGGPIGCELAQAFQRLGSEVTLFHKNDHILDREDSDAADILQKRFLQEAVRLVLNCNVLKVELRGTQKVVHFEVEGRKDTIVVDEILVGAGRVPNVENLGLEAAGVDYDSRAGVQVNDRLRTTNPKIYAAGDVSMKYKFTHMADAAARIVIQNALFRGSKKLSALTVPWCTYTDPEIAHVGMYEQDAARQGIAVDAYVRSLSDVDRAVADGEEEGFVKILCMKGTDKIIGATVVATHAGEMINELTLAMVGKLGLGTLATVIHPYPTQAEAIKQAADAYNRTRLTQFVKKLFTKWFAWTR